MGLELREETEMVKEIEMARVARLDRCVAQRSTGEIEMERERERVGEGDREREGEIWVEVENEGEKKLKIF